MPGEEGASTPTATKTPKMPKTPKAPKSAATKRKAAEVEGDVANDTPTKTTTKKKKTAKSDIKIKDEDAAEGHEQVATEGETNGVAKEPIKKKPATNGDIIKKEADEETLGAGVKLETEDESEGIDEEVGEMIS